jgi:hypothetical protein
MACLRAISWASATASGASTTRWGWWGVWARVWGARVAGARLCAWLGTMRVLTLAHVPGAAAAGAQAHRADEAERRRHPARGRHHPGHQQRRRQHQVRSRVCVGRGGSCARGRRALAQPHVRNLHTALWSLPCPAAAAAAAACVCVCVCVRVCVCVFAAGRLSSGWTCGAWTCCLW